MLVFRVLAQFTAAFYGFEAASRVLANYRIDLAAFFGARKGPVLPTANTLAAIVAAGCALSALGVGSLAAWPTLAAWFYIALQPPLRGILRRVCVGRLSKDHRLGDVLISDCLVSYASVLSDFALALHLLVTGASLDRAHVHPFILTVASLPVGVRIKQCFHDYRRTGDPTHIVNLFKYVTSNVPNVLRIQILENPGLAVYLPYALAVSAVYSLAWDLAVDWRLFAERPHKFMGWTYYAVAVLDVLLRFAWMLHNPHEYRIVALQSCELVRRWIWVLFRVEHEQQDLSIELT